MSDRDASPGSSRCKGHLGIEKRCDPLHHTSSRLDDAEGERGRERERERERESSTLVSSSAWINFLTFGQGQFLATW